MRPSKFAKRTTHARSDPTVLSVDTDLDEPIWRLAAHAFAAYAERRRGSGGGHPKRLLIDFLVGAHAVARADRLLTLDPDRYLSAFEGLRIEPRPTPAGASENGSGA